MATLKIRDGVRLAISYGQKVTPPSKYEVRIFQNEYRNSAIRSVYCSDIIDAMDLADTVRATNNSLVEVSEWDYDNQKWSLSYLTAPEDKDEMAMRELEAKAYEDWACGARNLYF